MKGMQRRTVLKQLGGATATLAVAGMGSAASLAGFGQEPRNPATTGILLNQVGLLPGHDKVATVRSASPSAPGAEFRLRAAAGGKVVYQGALSSPQLDAASGDQVRLAQFSSFTTPGSYRLEVDTGSSEPFLIAPKVYAPALRLAMRSYYGQRCGCAVDLGNGYKHPACHADGAYHVSSGRQGSVPNHGGWHDAGDYGRYVVNSGITTGTLLWAWELYPQVLEHLSLDIPESGRRLPDYLAEIRWNLEWMLSLQDADGGVWHKQTSEQFCAFIMPEQDHLTSYVIGTGAEPYKNTTATADLASVAAIAARCYRPYDAAFADRCLLAARRAWTWAMAHPQVPFTNPAHVGTGGYADQHCADELLWASAELWRTTGEPQYEQAFLAGMGDRVVVAAPSWGDVGPLALWTYVLAGREGNRAQKDRIRAATATAATTLVAHAQQSGYGTTMGLTDYVWGSNAVAANQSLLLLIADRFAPNRSCAEAALGNLHYLLGRNCHGVSWVTQVGTHPFEHPHHRPSAADGIAAPWPGLLSAGPCSGHGDEVARAMPAMPPMRRWADDQRAYSMNEIAINWNAPLVFLLAAANPTAL
ncbi:MAG TPA: glycoside hydrolase family 9 protein, partial [Acidobacteriaceae bacterium]